MTLRAAITAVALTVLGAQTQNTWSTPGCPVGEGCVAIRSCSAVVEQLQRAKAETESAARNQIISEVRDKVCGKRKERKVCCERELAAAPLEAEDSEPQKIGTFTNIFHDIAGTAYAVDSSTILIRGFEYDGEGPDAFFLAGSSGRPSRAGEVVLPFPALGRQYDYNDKDIPILGRFDGGEDIYLSLPSGWKVDELKWISVWCRDYQVNFGHVNVPANLKI